MTTEPTKETGWQRFERYVRAVAAWLLEFVKAASFRSEGKSTSTWCWIGGVACVLWLVYHPPGWMASAFGAVGSSEGTGEAIGGLIGVAGFAALKGLRRAIAGGAPEPPYYTGSRGPGGYQPPYGGSFDGYDGGIPGDTEWPVN